MRTQNDVNALRKNDSQGNIVTIQPEGSTTNQTQKSYSTSAAKLLLDQMERLKTSEITPENTLAMVACARAIADLIRANAEIKKLL